ncbi:MAG TPA: hypothetical protein VF384_15510 [Planctomycetota bacterium]
MKDLACSLSLAVLLLTAPLAAQDPAPGPEGRRPDASRKADAKAKDDDWCGWHAFARKHPDAARRVLAKADADHDGEIGHAERHAAKEAMKEWRREHVQEDWKEFAEEHPEAAKKLRAEIDKDGDGKLEPAERELAHKRMHACRQEGGERRKDGAEKPRKDGAETPQKDRTEKPKKDGAGKPPDAARKSAKGHDDWGGWRAFERKHPEAAKRVLAKADADHDGEIGHAERHAALAAMTEWRREHVQEDWKDFAEEHPEAAKKLRKEIDKDGDGKLELAERELAHKRMHACRAEGHDEQKGADKSGDEERPGKGRGDAKGDEKRRK